MQDLRMRGWARMLFTMATLMLPRQDSMPFPQRRNQAFYTTFSKPHFLRPT